MFKVGDKAKVTFKIKGQEEVTWTVRISSTLRGFFYRCEVCGWIFLQGELKGRSGGWHFCLSHLERINP